MKLKTIIFLSLILSLVSGAFAQDKTTKPATPAVDDKAAKPAATPPADAKPVAKPAPLPAVSEILAKYVKAIGGREAHEKMKSRAIKATLEIVPMGIKGTGETLESAPNKTYSVGNIAGVGEFYEGFDGEKAWSIDPVMGNRDKSGVELLQSKLNNNLHREINLDKLYSKLEVKGIEKVGDKDAYVVAATAEGVPSETFYFDVVSGLLVRTDRTVVSPEGNAAVKTFYEDYRDIEGVKLPYKTRTILPQFEMHSTVTEVKINVPVDEAKFAKPKQQ